MYRKDKLGFFEINAPGYPSKRTKTRLLGIYIKTDKNSDNYCSTFRCMKGEDMHTVLKHLWYNLLFKFCRRFLLCEYQNTRVFKSKCSREQDIVTQLCHFTTIYSIEHLRFVSVFPKTTVTFISFPTRANFGQTLQKVELFCLNLNYFFLTYIFYLHKFKLVGHSK